MLGQGFFVSTHRGSLSAWGLQSSGGERCLSSYHTNKWDIVAAMQALKERSKVLWEPVLGIWPWREGMEDALEEVMLKLRWEVWVEFMGQGLAPREGFRKRELQSLYGRRKHGVERDWQVAKNVSEMEEKRGRMERGETSERKEQPVWGFQVNKGALTFS